MGSAETGAAILDAVAQVRAANPRARYCCDPVIGDVGRGVFVRPGIPEFMREQAVRGGRRRHAEPVRARSPVGPDRARRAATRWRRSMPCTRSGRKAILVTSLHTDETPADAIDLVASDASGRFRVRTPKLPISVNGAGDAIAALFFAHYLRTGSAAEALSRAASSIFGAAQAHRRRRLARDPAGRGAGRIRQSKPRVSRPRPI